MSDPAARAGASAARIELRETDRAFNGLRDALVAKMLATPSEAAQTRETCYFAVNALDAVREALRQVVENGDIDEAVEAMTIRPSAQDSDLTIAPIRGAR